VFLLFENSLAARFKRSLQPTPNCLPLLSNPLGDVRWAVAEFDALDDAGSEKAHRLNVHACDFPQIEYDVPSNPLEFSLQFQNSFGIHSTAESKDRFLLFGASVNFESHV
jgi:hypothetical protein